MTRFFRLRNLPALLLGLALAVPAMAADGESTQALMRFFQGQTRAMPSAPIDFEVTAGFAILHTASPDSSGHYAMTAINVTRVATDIYRLDMSLEKPQPRDIPSWEQPYFYTLTRTYYFWYQNGDTIIFKVAGKRVSLPTGRKDVLRVDIHSPDTYSIDRQTMLHNLTFSDGADTYVLQIRFK
jgi:hypothetical protein